MKRRLRSIHFVLAILTMVSLACSFMGIGANKSDTQDSPSSAKTSKYLDEEYRSDIGGFSISKAKDYQFEDVIGIVNMRAADSDPDIGPAIMVMGGTMEKEYTNDELMEKMKQNTNTLTLSNTKKIKVNGVEGLSADIGGKYGDQAVKGKVVVAMVTPTQQFNIMGMAPSDRWAELSPVYEAVLGTVKFFEPKPDSAPANESTGSETSGNGASEEGLSSEESSEDAAAGGDSTSSDPNLIRQWAKSARASSSYSTVNWAASQATGKPDVDNCGDSSSAWASERDDSVEWIELSYATPVVPSEINIYQSYNPSQVVEVYMMTVDGTKYLAWEGEPETVEYCPDLMTITLDMKKQILVNKVRIVIDQSVMGWGWSEIDAVELVGYNAGAQPQGASGSSNNPQKTAAAPVSNEPAPTNYTGWMAGSVYQGYLKVVSGKTKKDELNKLIGIEGTRSTENWKPRPDHADTFIFKLGQDNMLAWISVTTEGVVYKKSISANTHPSDYKLNTVTKATYDQLDAIFKRDKVVPYNVVANTIKSPGFLLEQVLREDGRMMETYQWYHPNGDYISGTFYDGKMTGIAGLAFIPNK